MIYNEYTDPKFIKTNDYLFDLLVKWVIFNAEPVEFVFFIIISILPLVIILFVFDGGGWCFLGVLMGLIISYLLSLTNFFKKLTEVECYNELKPDAHKPYDSFDYNTKIETYYQRQYNLTFNIERNVE